MDLNKMIEKEKILINKASYRQLEKKKIAKPVNATAQCRLCWKYTIQTSIWRYILCTIFISSSPLYVPTVVLILLCSFTRKQNKKNASIGNMFRYWIIVLHSAGDEKSRLDRIIIENWLARSISSAFTQLFNSHAAIHTQLCVNLCLFYNNHDKKMDSLMSLILRHGFSSRLQA